MKSVEELEAERRRANNSLKPYWIRRREVEAIEKKIMKLEFEETLSEDKDSQVKDRIEVEEWKY